MNEEIHKFSQKAWGSWWDMGKALREKLTDEQMNSSKHLGCEKLMQPVLGPKSISDFFIDSQTFKKIVKQCFMT